MTPQKNYRLLIAATALITGSAIPLSFADDLRLVPLVPAPTQVESDSTKCLINTQLLEPLALLASFRQSFSRRGPSHSTSYHLAETSTKGSQEERTFTVIQKVTPPYSKSKTPEAKSSDFLKVRHLAGASKIQVDLKGKWVELSQHPILKSLPEPKPTKQITP